MVDSSTGWVTCADGSVLRTTDGGLNWGDVTPPAMLSLKLQNGVAESLFADASSAWIVVIDGSSTATIRSFHTSDAGQTWQEGTLRTNVSLVTAGPFYQIEPVSTHEAWVLEKTVGGAGAGPNGGANYGVGGLYHTTDSGTTWIQAQNLPAIGQHNSPPTISFANQQTGIITGSVTTNQTHTGMIYLTQDGGASWHVITLPLPNQPSQWTFNGLFSPQFLTATDGIVFASFSGPFAPGDVPVPLGVVVLSTHDGGQTWTSSPIVNMATGHLGGAMFFSTQQGYLFVYAGQAEQVSIFYTSDGGQHWSQVDHSLPALPFSSADFSSPTLGWVIGVGNGQDGTQYTILYTTTDGGKTWTQVHAHFPSFITPQSAY